MLDDLRNRLLDAAGKAIDGVEGTVPGDLSRILHRLMEHDLHLELSLLACASSRWCGGDPLAGLPVAVATLFLRTGITVHLGTEGFPRIPGATAAEAMEDGKAVLAGDALIALAMERLVTDCGRHSTILVEEAVLAVGSRGVLSGLSLMLDEMNHRYAPIPDGLTPVELYSGQLARFASYGGAVSAGATGLMLDDAARIGLLTGRARFLSCRAVEESNPSVRERMESRAALDLEQARQMVGSGERGALFTALMYFADFM